MARGPIPFYQQQTLPQAQPGTPRVPATDSGARALAGLSDTFGAMQRDQDRQAQEAERQRQEDARLMQAREDRRAVADAAMQIQDADLAISTFERDTQAATAGDPDGYTGKVAKFTDDIRDRLFKAMPNEAGRMALETHFASLRNRTLQGAMRWEAGRATQYDADRAGDLVQQQSAELVRDPSLVDAYRDISNMQLDASRLDAHQRERLRDAREKAYRQAIGQGRLTRDPQGVLDATGARLGVTDPQETAEPVSVAQSLATADVEVLYGALVEQESGGRRYGRDGKLLTSEKGAQGEGQVMPYTAADPGYGVLPVRNDSPDELARLSRDYFHAMVREFPDDRAQAVAAYNAGPGAVKGAVKRYGAEWLAHLPAETRAYVAAIGAKVAQPEPVKVAALDTGTMTDAAANAPKVGDAWADSLAPDELVRYYREAQTAVERQQHAARGGIEQQVADAAARADDGVRDRQPIPAASFIAAWGPVEGARRNYAYQQTQSYAGDVASLQGMPTGQIMALLDERRAQEVGPEAGAAVRSALNARLTRAAQTVVKQREDDGAGYAIKTAPSVKAAADRVFAPQGPAGVPLWLDQSAPVDDRRAAMRDYLTRSQAEQQRLGIQNVALLPATAEAYIVRAANANAGKGDQFAATVQGVADTFGSFWPQVYRQVVGGKNGANVPDAFVVIPGIPAARVAAREEIARVDAIKVDDLRKQLPDGTAKDIDNGLQAALAPWFESMMAGQQNTRTAAAVRRTAEKVALARATNGASVSDAVNGAVDDVIGHLAFQRGGSIRTYVVPKAEAPEQVERGVHAAVERLPLWNLPAPPDISGSRTPEEASAEWSRMVRARPLWVTNSNEDGLLLYTVGQNGQPVAVRWQGGDQVEFKFDALRSFAAEVAEADKGLPGVGARPGGREQAERARATARQAELEAAARRRGVQ